MKYLSLLLLFCFSASATLSDVDKQMIVTENLLVNGGFENGKTNWVSTGTFAIATSGSNLLKGLASGTFNASGAGQYLRTALIAIPNGLKGKPGIFQCDFLTPSGAATHTITVSDGTNTLATANVTSNTNPVRDSVHFLFPTSGSVRGVITAVAADEPLISVDSCVLGNAEGVSLIPAKPQDVFSAYVADGSSTTTVSRENADWINGNCTNGSTGNYTCTFNSGVFSATPNCSVIPSTSSSGVIATVVAGASSIAIKIDNNAGSAFDSDFVLSCQKSGVDSPAIAFKADTLANSWSGYFDNTCSFVRTNTAYGDATDASCALTERTNRNFGTVTSNAASNIGIIFTPKSAGKYEICAYATAQGATAGTDQNLRLWDGTTVISERGFQTKVNTYYENVPLCGQYVASSTSAVTISVQTKSSSGAITVAVSPGSSSAIEWSIMKIDQSFPAPMIANSVVTKSSAVMGIESANLNCDAGSAITAQNGTWISSIGNISAGVCTVTIAAGIFSSTPFCTATPNSGVIVYMSGVTTTNINLGAISDAGANSTSFDARIICVGPR